MATIIGAIGSAVVSAKAALGLGAAAGAAGGLSGLSTALSIGGALASISQGAAKSRRLKQEASFAEVEATEETRAGATKAANLAREYADLRSEQTVIQLANGLNIGVGTPVSIANATQRQADRNTSITRENAQNRSKMARLRSRGLLSEARGALSGSFVNAGQIGAQALQLTG